MDEAERMDLAMGLAIRITRHGKGRSQASLAQAIGVSFQQVQKYETGANRVSFSMLAHIARALGCTVPALAATAGALAQARPQAGADDPLVTPEAAGVLEALSEIRSAALREALLGVAQDLGGAA